MGLQASDRPRQLLSQSVLLLAAERRGWRLDPSADSSDQTLMALIHVGKNDGVSMPPAPVRQYFWYYATPLSSYVGSKVFDSKMRTQQALVGAGIPVPRFVVLAAGKNASVAARIDIVRRGALQFPVVFKSSVGSHGTNVVLDIHDIAQLTAVVGRSARESVAYVVEEQAPADAEHYRVLAIDGVVVDVVRRIPARVVCSGNETLLASYRYPSTAVRVYFLHCIVV